MSSSEASHAPLKVQKVRWAVELMREKLRMLMMAGHHQDDAGVAMFDIVAKEPRDLKSPVS